MPHSVPRARPLARRARGRIAALLALCLAPAPALAQIDPVARGMAGAAQSTAGRFPLTHTPRIAFACDSWSDFNRNVSAAPTTVMWTSFGYINSLRAHYGKRFYTDPSLEFGIAGQTTSYYLTTEVPQIIAAKPDILIVYCGTNDDNTYPVLTTSVANMQKADAQLSAAGIAVIHVGLVAQGSWNGAKKQWMAEFNRQMWLQSLNPALNVRYVDLNPTMSDYSTGLVVSGLLVGDNVHPSVLGGIAIAAAIEPVLDQLLPAIPDLQQLTDDEAYDPTLNPSGNMLLNGMMTGTAGSALSPAAGAVATDWQCHFSNYSAPTTLTMACSKGTDSSYTNESTQVITIGGTADGDRIRFEAMGTSGALWTMPALAAGAAVYGECKISGTGLTNIASIQLLLVITVNGTTYTYWDGEYQNTGSSPGYSPGALPSTYSALRITPALTLPTGTVTSTRFYLEIQPMTSSTATSGAVTVEQCAVRQAGLGHVAQQ
jgi:lysophospholipase L1-like esterase